ncbi:putative regulator of chromosome condensation 1/beta-lactamase-inhibitor protein II [Plasmopara halstedii]
MGDAFLRALSAELEQIQRALSPRCLFCVPHTRALLISDTITQDVLYTHFLTPADADAEPKRPLGAYNTLNGKHVTVVGSHVHTGKGFRDRIRVRILLSEKRNVCHQEVTVLYISRPLEGGLQGPDDPNEIDVATLRKYTAIIKSFPENEFVFHQLDDTINHIKQLRAHNQAFDQHKQLLSSGLREEWETAVDELNRAGTFNDVGKDSIQYGESDGHLLQIQQVVECYLMENVHDVVFPIVVASCREQDAKLHQVLYQLRYYTPEDFGLRKEYQCFLADARDTLFTITQKKTPLDMLLVFKRCIEQITDATTQNIKLRSLSFDAYQLTTDDILDQLLVVLVQLYKKFQRGSVQAASELTTPFCITAVIQYISDFHFINSSTTALGFAMANFQVAVEYFLLRADHRDDCQECANLDLKTDYGCSLAIKESKCMRASREIRHDLSNAMENVERARAEASQKSLQPSNSIDFKQNDLMTAKRVSIIGNWSDSTGGNGVKKRIDTDVTSPCALCLHPVKFGLGERQIELNDTRVTQVGGGQRFFAMVTEDGSLFTWGDSSGGRLGYAIADGDSRRVTIPRRVIALQQQCIVQVACGGFHAIATDINGHVFTWGSNLRGQLGYTSSETSIRAGKMPSALESLRGLYVSSVACGEYHSLALTADGCVYSWGCNKYGKLGRVANLFVEMAHPRQIEANWTDRAPDVSSTKRFQDSYVVRIAAGKDHSLATSSDGALFTWGVVTQVSSVMDVTWT